MAQPRPDSRSLLPVAGLGGVLLLVLAAVAGWGHRHTPGAPQLQAAHRKLHHDGDVHTHLGPGHGAHRAPAATPVAASPARIRDGGAWAAAPCAAHDASLPASTGIRRNPDPGGRVTLPLSRHLLHCVWIC